MGSEEGDNPGARVADKIENTITENTEYDSADDFFENDGELGASLSLTEEEADVYSSVMKQQSALKSRRLPEAHIYLTVGELYLRITKKEEKMGETIQSAVENVKEDYEFEDLSPDEKEAVGTVISDGVENMMPGIFDNDVEEDFLLIQTLITELIQKHVRELYIDELIVQEYRNSETEKLLKELSQDQIESLLLRSGVISEDLRSELSHVRGVRNSIVHDIQERILLNEVDSLSSEVRRSIITANDLLEQTEGVRPIRLQTD